MTVSYQYEVASSTSGGFTRLLFMWRGSLYKLIYRELLLFLCLFAAISALYRYVLTKPHKRKFEQIVVWCDTFISLIPLSFVLGFYVAYVAARWWQQYIAIPWPDKVMHLVALYVTGNDEYSRMLRRALMRYLNLSLILVLRSISSAVKRRFPTLDHVVDSGFMTSLELDLFQSVPSVEFNTYWIPCTWFINLLKEARSSHRLPDAQGLKIIMEEFNDFRSKCGLLWSYDWVSIPLVYTQVVTLATYSFFVVALMGRQYIEGTNKSFQMEVDAYLPLFTILQFFFYMGLLKIFESVYRSLLIDVTNIQSEYFSAFLKVAEQLINPFGDDDEDFELNWLIDRHTKVSYLGVDTLMNRCPPLVKDIYYDAENLTLPYTEAAAGYKRKTYRGSVANMTVPEEKQTMFLPDIREEDEDSKTSVTPRTSTASIVHSYDSPVNGRRQISGSPSTTPKMGRNGTETIVQLDLQEINDEIDQQRGPSEAMKKTSARSSKCSTPRMEQNRKPFFVGAKAAKMNLQPWPSATNLARLGVNQYQQQASESTSFTKNENDAGNSGSSSSRRTSSMAPVQHPPCIAVNRYDTSMEDCGDDDDQLDRLSDNGGFVNSAFSQEYLAESEGNESFGRRYPDDPVSHNRDEHSDVLQFQCLREEIFRQPEHRANTYLEVAPMPRRRFNSCPKFLVRRQSSTGNRKKGVRWKRNRDSHDTSLRRKTVDCVPSAKKFIPQASSSPNLKIWTISSTASRMDQTKEESRETKEDNDDDNKSFPKRIDNP